MPFPWWTISRRFHWHCGPMNTDTNEFTETCWVPENRSTSLCGIQAKGPAIFAFKHIVGACYRSGLEDEMRKLFAVLCIALVAVAQAASQTSSSGASTTTL